MNQSLLPLAVAQSRLRDVLHMTLSTMALLLGMQSAWAACSRVPGYTAKTINIAMGKVIVPSDLAVNGVIQTRIFDIPVIGAQERMARCVNGGTIYQTVSRGTATNSSSRIYSTNVSGVGIRIADKYATAGRFANYPYQASVSGTRDAAVLPGAQVRVELIKTAAVTGNGPLDAGTYTQSYGDGDFIVLVSTMLSANGTTLITPSCTVDAGSRNIPVNFGKVATTSFRGRSSTAGDRNFNVRLNCSAGQNARNTVQIRMDATADPASVDGVLRITQAAAGTNTAVGVGIQIVDATTKAAVKFGDTVDVGPSKDGSYVLPYTARYYQTGNTVTPGQANGTATFTLDYK